jgi:hypothetical protein
MFRGQLGYQLLQARTQLEGEMRCRRRDQRFQIVASCLGHAKTLA